MPVPDADFRHRVDAEVADYILVNIERTPGEVRTTALRALCDRAVAAAVATARAWRRVAASANVARTRVERARIAGGYWIDALEQRWDALEHEAAALMIDAYVQSEEAEGVARAAGLARSGHAWTPYNHHKEAEALFFGVGRRSA
jgi:hypothetical protein